MNVSVTLVFVVKPENEISNSAAFALLYLKVVVPVILPKERFRIDVNVAVIAPADCGRKKIMPVKIANIIDNFFIVSPC